jgi:hypothetical protein
MKALLLLAATMALVRPAWTQDEFPRSDIQSDIPLAEAIRRVNRAHPAPQPLTEDEVVAAVGAIKLTKPQISEEVYRIYQRVIDERIIPAGVSFSHVSEWRTQFGQFKVDWLNLNLMPLGPLGRKDEKMGHGFNYRIRARFISSRPLTQEEQRQMQEETKQLRKLQDAIDGLEPAGAASQSQPAASQAVQTSKAAGSGR